jgi:hypothetical protein
MPKTQLIIEIRSARARDVPALIPDTWNINRVAVCSQFYLISGGRNRWPSAMPEIGNQKLAKMELDNHV